MSKNVKNRQKGVFSALFDILRTGQKTSKVDKKCQRYVRHFSTISRGTSFPAPLQRTPWGGGKKRGEENLTNDTPPKEWFWTPIHLVPWVSLLCVQKNLGQN